MPQSHAAGSSRRKSGQPTVCLECYLRKVKCDRKRPCNTCTRRGTQHLCKTFDTSELDAETLQKKQSRRSASDINAFLAAHDDHDPDPQQHEPSSEHPMTTFLNHLLKDLNASDDAESPSPRSVSQDSTGTPYADDQSLALMVAFCAVLPEWNQLATLIRHYIWHVDWKFLITSQDMLEPRMRDLWLRVILPCRTSVPPDGSINRNSFQHGDLSRLALLATVIGETIETMDPDSIADVLPASRPGKALPTDVKMEADANPRVRALLLIVHHIPILIAECVRLDEMTIDLVQANVAAFSIWTNQGLHSFGKAVNFPQWDVTMRAAKGCKLFEDPESPTGTPLSRCELDHHRRLAWLVYGYDHAFAVGANTKPLIVDAQFSVDGPSDAPPWSASGSPPDPCLAMLEVQGAKIAQMVSTTLCYGPPLHRKLMETDRLIMSVMSQLHPTYVYDQPDTSLDVQDPFRARRRCWLQLTTAWQRGSLHRHCFFPNGRINNGELATSRHIATDSAIRSITAVRELRGLQNRFCDYQGSAWYYQYLTEPNMTLATGALLLIRSKGRGVPGLADEANCWPTVMRFIKTIDESLQEINASMKDSSVCLPSFLSFGQRCSQLIRQLRAAVQTGIDSLIKADPGVQHAINVQVDDSLLSLLHPRARNRSPLVAVSSEASSSSASSKTGVGRKRQRCNTDKATSTTGQDLPATAAALSLSTSSQPSNSSTASSISPQDLRIDLPPVGLDFGPAASASQVAQPPGGVRNDTPGSVGFGLAQQLGLSHQAPSGLTPHLGVPTGDSLASMDPSALQNFYSDTEIQRANEGGGLGDWISSIQMDLMLPHPDNT